MDVQICTYYLPQHTCIFYVQIDIQTDVQIDVQLRCAYYITDTEERSIFTTTDPG